MPPMLAVAWKILFFLFPFVSFFVLVGVGGLGLFDDGGEDSGVFFFFF